MSRSRVLPKRYKTSIWILLWFCTPLVFAAEIGSSPKETIKHGTLVEPAHGPLVVLTDGGLLVARPIGLISPDKQRPNSKREILLDSRLFGKIPLPTDRVAGIVFHPSPGVEARDAAIARLFDSLRTKDRVTLVNGDRLGGPLLDIKDRQITMDTPFGQTDLKLDQVASITFATKEQEKKGPPRKTPAFFTGWSDGSRLPVTKMRKTRQKQLRIWPDDATRKPWTAPVDKLRFLQPLSRKETVYLSDLTPSEYLHTPLLDHRLPLGKDRNVLGRPLRADGVLYPKGLGTASRSKLVYTLDEPFSRFEAELAIDDSTGGRGSVLFRVLLDGKPVYTSPTIRGGQRPIPLSIDTTDAKQLELEVDYADRGDQLDRANWLDARLNRKTSNKE